MRLSFIIRTVPRIAMTEVNAALVSIGMMMKKEAAKQALELRYRILKQLRTPTWQTSIKAVSCLSS